MRVLELAIVHWQGWIYTEQEVSRTGWEEQADGPADAVRHLVAVDPEGGKALGGMEELWPRH